MRTGIKHMWNILIVNCITNSIIWNTGVTWQGIWLQAPWGWHDSVETCSSVIICEIIVYLLVIVQNEKVKKAFALFVLCVYNIVQNQGLVAAAHKQLAHSLSISFLWEFLPGSVLSLLLFVSPCYHDPCKNPLSACFVPPLIAIPGSMT